MKKALTFNEKMSTLNEMDEGLKKKTEIPKSYGIPRNILSTIIKEQE